MMTDEEVGRYWDANADAWTALSRAGYDAYRDLLNTPAFLEMLPDVSGKNGLDIGCGEGSNTRRVAQRGAKMVGVDISPRFIAHAIDAERNSPMGISYQVGSGQSLPFADTTFDFATAFMCLMDMPDPRRAFAEVRRVVKPGGFFQFSITHPCFDTPQRRNLRGSDGKTYAVEIGRYFDNIDGRIDTWSFSAAPQEVRAQHRPFQVPRFHRTLSQWINMILEAGLVLERLEEPRVSEEVANQHLHVQDTRVVAYFLHVRCRV